jgi:GNAT superfamily N-acetyltransferase
METTQSTVSVAELPVPSSLNAPGGSDFRAVAELFNAAALEELGHADFAVSHERRLAQAQPSAYAELHVFVAREQPAGAPGPAAAGRVVGAATAYLQLRENRQMVSVELAVVPGRRRRGIGSALLATVEEFAAARGRGTINGWVDVASPSADTGGARDAEAAAGRLLSPEKGDGAVAADAPSSSFALAHGMELQQVERVSRLEVPVDERVLRAMSAEAARGAGDAYDIVGWSGPVPQWAARDYCRLAERMDTDPPMGGLEFEPSVWDERRLRTLEERAARRGQRSVVSCAREKATGRLVAFTECVLMQDSPHAAFQEGTLVLGEFRGHRLGMLVKVANYRRLLAEHPAVERIYTWNAEENRHMLRINIAMGYRPAHLEAAWGKKPCTFSP